MRFIKTSNPLTIEQLKEQLKKWCDNNNILKEAKLQKEKKESEKDKNK